MRIDIATNTLYTPIGTTS